MKILVVSLLRLGDVIQQRMLIVGLRRQNPTAEIHLLVNKQFDQISELFGPLIDQYHYFDRTTLQKSLGEPNYNLFWGYNYLQSFVESLSLQKFDVIYNFTHNKLSAYLIGLIPSTTKKGIWVEHEEFKGLNNRWIDYFNERFSGLNKSYFHYIELLGKSLEIPVSLDLAGLSEGNRKREKLILFQCLTSDPKKNWGLKNFKILKSIIESELVDYEVCVLAAHFEKEALLDYFTEADLLVCDLKQVMTHLSNASLLVTGDTSIKHLAAQCGTPLVELALGSSDHVKTSAYTKNSVILKSRMSCAPCNHSAPCSQKSHMCAQDISVDQVFGAVWDQLSEGKIPSPDLEFVLDKKVWNFYLDGGDKNVRAAFYEAGCDILSDFDLKEISEKLVRWGKLQTRDRQLLSILEGSIASIEELTRRNAVQRTDYSRLIQIAQEIVNLKEDQSGFFQGYIECFMISHKDYLSLNGKIQKSLSEIRDLIEIRRLFADQLQSLVREGVFYAREAGQLLEDRTRKTRGGTERDHQNEGVHPRSRENAIT